MTVKVNYLVNLKSGLCPEDCGYCSQALGSTSEILKYTWLKEDEALDQARAGVRGGASRVCMVASGRGPTDRDIERVAGMVGAIKEENPEVEVCACLGLLRDGQADRLREAGVDAYNHNINTAESHHESIVTTHTYEDRVRTVAMAQGAGLSACSGLIAGLGESDEQLVEAPLIESVCHYADLARQAGLAGVVCSALEARAIADATAEDFLRVTPGIRPAGSAVGDQARVATPGTAASMGSSAIVVGRPITKADDPVAAYHTIRAAWQTGRDA